jgi:glucan phosphorylase
VLAVAYDVMIPGCYTKTTNNLHLWESKPKRGFDLNSFNTGNYEGVVEASNSGAAITSVLYPKDHPSLCVFLLLHVRMCANGLQSGRSSGSSSNSTCCFVD